jgi:hypothetical protein
MLQRARIVVNAIDSQCRPKIAVVTHFGFQVAMHVAIESSRAGAELRCIDIETPWASTSSIRLNFRSA